MGLSRREVAGAVVAVVAVGIAIGGGIGFATLDRGAPAPPGTVPTGALPTLPILRDPSAENAGFPRFVPKREMDPRYAGWLRGDPVVLVDSGVFAEARPDGVLGMPGDYPEVVGKCLDVERYLREHPARSRCW